MTYFSCLSVALLLLTVISCSNPQPNTVAVVEEPPVVADVVMQSIADVAKSLITQIDTHMVDDRRILMTTIVNIHNLDDTAPYGRVAAQMLATQFTAQGFSVLEAKMRSDLAIRQQQGEFILSRDLNKLSKEQRVQAIAAGTYAVAGDKVYVNLRVIRASDNIAIASHDFVLPYDSSTANLFRPNHSMYDGILSHK